MTFDLQVGDVTLPMPNTARRQVKNTGDYDVMIRTNEAGLRDSSLAGASERDLYAVGDSFTFGWGVSEEDRYSNVLASLRHQRVRNLASPADITGYGALLAYAIRHGARPHRIVIGLCMENDLRDYALPRPSPAVSDRLTEIKRWLLDNSATYAVISAASHGVPIVVWLGRRMGVVTDVLDDISPREFDARIIRSSIAELRRVTGSFDATILIIPSRALWLGSTAGRADARRIHDAVVSGLLTAGFRVADPRQPFEASGHPLGFHFPTDGHWNRAGHAVAARLLARAVDAAAPSLTQ